MGTDSFVVKTNKQSDKKETKQQKKENAIELAEPSRLENSDDVEKHSKPTKNYTENQKKSKMSKRIGSANKQSTKYKILKSSKIYQQISTTDKKEKKKSFTGSIKNFISKNRKMTMAVLGSYLVLIGIIIGTPIIVNHLKPTHLQVQKYKERLIINEQKKSRVTSC